MSWMKWLPSRYPVKSVAPRPRFLGPEAPRLATLVPV